MAGVLVGGAASLAIRRLVSSQLYGVEPTDARVLLLVAVALAGVALLASVIPARRAIRLDLMQVLKTD